MILAESILEKLAIYCVFDLSLTILISVLYLIYKHILVSFYWLIFIYLIWYIYDRNTPNKGSRRIQQLRYYKLSKYFMNYFPIRFHCKNPQLFNAKNNYIFCSHPHGILCIGTTIAFSTEALNWSKYFPDIRPHIVSSYKLFRLPFFREMLQLLGHISSSKESFDHILSRPEKGYALGLIVGGAEEMALNDPDQYILYLNKRMGFIKIALTYGAHLVPVFCFGENRLYRRSYIIQNFVEKYVYSRYPSLKRISFIVYYGCGLLVPFGILPFRNPINVVVGDPIVVEKVTAPTKEQIDKLHDLYKRELEKLFELEKSKFIKENPNSYRLVFT